MLCNLSLQDNCILNQSLALLFLLYFRLYLTDPVMIGQRHFILHTYTSWCTVWKISGSKQQQQHVSMFVFTNGGLTGLPGIPISPFMPGGPYAPCVNTQQEWTVTYNINIVISSKQQIYSIFGPFYNRGYISSVDSSVSRRQLCYGRTGPSVSSIGNNRVDIPPPVCVLTTTATTWHV